MTRAGAFEIDVTDLAESEIAALRAFDKRRVLDAIERNLRWQPNIQTRNRKKLTDAPRPFHHVPPAWEVRVGEFRIYYDVDVAVRVVNVRSVRRKKPHMTTEQVFDENADD